MASANGFNPQTPQFNVRVNGADLPPDAVTDLISVAVYEDLEAPNMFVLKLANWDMDKLTVKWSDDDLCLEGGEVEVQMGYLDSLETLIIGEITGLEPEFLSNETPTVTIRGHDRLHRLLRGRKTRSFTAMKDSEIFSQIARDLGLAPDAEDTKIILDYVMQRNQTDMEFLRGRARRIGFEITAEDKTVFFRSHQHATAEVLTLAQEGDLIEFYPRLTTMTQVGQVVVRGWNSKEKVGIVGRAKPGDESGEMDGAFTGPDAVDTAFDPAETVWVDWPVSTQAEADQIAVGRFNSMALAYINGEGLCEGRTDLRAGTVIRIDGLGERFSGLYYVTSTTHTCSPSKGYQTAFTVRRNAA